jgi:sugar/nucleoside kinase (ribokinase family)
MERGTTDKIPDLIALLEKGRNNEYSAFLGFDACIDYIVRVVSEKDDKNETGYFTTSRQFGEYIISHESKSCGIELETRISKLGGNMAITANALGNMGVKTECAGTFGYPDILPFFRAMSPKCTLHTIGDTITATALEFSNTKVILFDPGPYNNLTWDSIKELIGVEEIKNWLMGKQLISFLNWSEIEHSSEIWRGILDEIVPSVMPIGKKLPFFTDFSDCSRRSASEIINAIELLSRFREYFKVILSLNHNEADLVAVALGLSQNYSDEDFVKSLYKLTNTDILIIHRTEDAIAYDGVEFKKCETFLCKDPVILTGGGDNFNAGFCMAQLMGSGLFNSLLTANAVSGYYVKNGISPDIKGLTEFLKQNLKNQG